MCRIEDSPYLPHRPALDNNLVISILRTCLNGGERDFLNLMRVCVYIICRCIFACRSNVLDVLTVYVPPSWNFDVHPCVCFLLWKHNACCVFSLSGSDCTLFSAVLLVPSSDSMTVWINNELFKKKNVSIHIIWLAWSNNLLKYLPLFPLEGRWINLVNNKDNFVINSSSRWIQFFRFW